jgi:hypothetical protein
MRLTLLGESLLGGKQQFGAKSKKSPTESILATLPPPELNSAAACLLQMSRNASTPNDLIEDDDDEEYEPVPVVTAAVIKEEAIVPEAAFKELNHKKLNSITFPFCDTCTSAGKSGSSSSKTKKQHHHSMCPKNPECNRIKLEKIVRGYNVGCACCEREFEVGPHRGRHEAHSI